MNDSRNIHGWILNPTNNRRSDGIQIYEAHKKGLKIIGCKADIITMINDLEKMEGTNAKETI